MIGIFLPGRRNSGTSILLRAAPFPDGDLSIERSCADSHASGVTYHQNKQQLYSCVLKVDIYYGRMYYAIDEIKRYLHSQNIFLFLLEMCFERAPLHEDHFKAEER